MKSVFLVECGERYEGSQIISVHLSKKNAINAAKNVDTYFEGGWKEIAEDSYWTNGCDFVRVFQMEVRE